MKYFYNGIKKKERKPSKLSNLSELEYKRNMKIVMMI
jgi:hypothetical protein